MLGTEFQKPRGCESGGCFEVAQGSAAGPEGAPTMRSDGNGGVIIGSTTSNHELYFDASEWDAFRFAARTGQFDPC